MFPYEAQPDGSEWCWAACMRMSAAYFNCPPVPPMCALAQRWIPGASGCCQNPSIPDSCNRALGVDAVQQAFASIGVRAANIAPPSEAATQNTLRYSGLVLMLLDLGLPHFVLVTGYNPQQQTYGVADPGPQYGCADLPWDTISSGYGLGGITYSWSLTRVANAPFAYHR